METCTWQGIFNKYVMYSIILCRWYNIIFYLQFTTSLTKNFDNCYEIIHSLLCTHAYIFISLTFSSGHQQDQCLEESA